MGNNIKDCVLCHKAACSKACKNFDVERVLRAIKFENKEAISFLDFSLEACETCDAPCKDACPKKVNLKEIISKLCKEKKDFEAPKDFIPDLSCDICGVRLENPFILSSSVVASSYEMIARAFDMGWAGACYKTISLMDIHEASPRFSAMKGEDGEFLGFKNIEQLSDHSLEENLEIISKLKNNYPSKIIIVSIMGRSEKEWEYLSQKTDEAGADVIELNFSCPNMEEKNTGVDIGQDPELVMRLTAAARRGTNKPILAKMTPNITDMRIPARAAIKGGADGIAAINTIKSITGVNLDSLVASPEVKGKSALGGYSGRAVKPIALRFIAEMRNDESLKGAHISGMGGIYTWKDAVEFLLLGAGSIQITTSVMEYGYRVVEDLILGLSHFMRVKGFTKLSDFIGASAKTTVDLDEIERDTIVYPIFNKDKCILCGRCYISCRDGGHQAITFKEDRRPALNGAKCVGCHLCLLVCPAKAIIPSDIRVKKK